MTTSAAAIAEVSPHGVEYPRNPCLYKVDDAVEQGATMNAAKRPSRTPGQNKGDDHRRGGDLHILLDVDGLVVHRF